MKIVLITVLCLFSLNVTAVQAEIALKFGVYTSDKPTAMVKAFRPILNALEAKLTKKLGEPTKLSMQVASSYDRGIDDIVAGRVDFARIGPASYVTASERNPDVKLLAMESKKGKRVFFGIICVPENSHVHEIRQLKGLAFAFGDEKSTIGRYLSQQYLARHGVYADNLARYDYLDRHDKVGAAVGARQYDAGALKESTFNKLKKKGIKIRELARFPNVTKPWIASSKVTEIITDALSEALLELKDPTALKALKKAGFLPAKDSDYATIRESMQNNHKFFRERDGS
ncbi:MAG: PhnD/SsuA/transferrin family substrate-binding protein [Gammaproteobacteria bacterium]|nr:PhnD/SsuA/transferrin family substrate-binding protein [Gammaproteobacteria bacterium]